MRCRPWGTQLRPAVHAVLARDISGSLGLLLQACLPIHYKRFTACDATNSDFAGLLYLQVRHRAQAAHARVLHPRAARSNCMERIVGQVHRGIAFIGLRGGIVVVPQPQQRLVAGQLMPVNQRDPSVPSSHPGSIILGTGHRNATGTVRKLESRHALSFA